LHPTGQAPRLDWLFAKAAMRDSAEQRPVRRASRCPRRVPWELASFYGLQIPTRFNACDRAQMFDERFE
jgi:hypothetical protein